MIGSLYLFFKKYFFKFDWSRLGFSHLFLYYPFLFYEFEWTLLSRQGPNELFTMGRHTYSLSNAFLARKKLIKCKCEVQGKNWSDNHALGESPRTISAIRTWIIWWDFCLGLLFPDKSSNWTVYILYKKIEMPKTTLLFHNIHLTVLTNYLILFIFWIRIDLKGWLRLSRQ